MRLILLNIFLFFGVSVLAEAKVDTLPKFQSNTIVVKLKPEFGNLYTKDSIDIPQLSKIFRKYEVTAKQLFSHSENTKVSLSSIFELSHAIGNTSQLIAVLNAQKYFQYVEPKAINYIDFIPNDQYIDELWHLDTIKAYQAWDIQEGDTNIVIGIIDTGMDMDHEDLYDAVKYNYDDPLDGLDNDNDGYIDNYKGWDMSDNDNNPQEAAEFQHGTAVAGCVAPVTNNSIGIAGAGFKCKILPIKAVKDGNSPLNGLDKGYEGIVYAVDQGAKIVNCSWGSSYASQYGKDIVDYAVSQGSLVVAAAGNTSSNAPHYPAAFDGVLAVGNTLKSDVLAPTSGRGYWLDLCAPGSSIKSTTDGDNYNTNSGTSFAAPIAAGGAALVMSEFPDLNPIQIIERLKATADSIVQIVGNNDYLNQLGDGRLNLYQAISKTDVPAIKVSEYLFDDRSNLEWQSNDTITLQVSFTNVLDSTGGLVAELNSLSTYVSIIDSTFSIGSLKQDEFVSNTSDLFKFTILGSTPFNEEIEFTIDISSSNGYIKSVPFVIDINNYYVDVLINNIGLSVSSDGQIGYYEEDQAAGIGITYNESNSLLYDGSFMVGVPGKVADMARGLRSVNDKDFIAIARPKALEIAQTSDFDVTGMFSDSIPFNFDNIGLRVRQNTYAWDKVGHKNYIIQEYIIINRSAQVLDSLRAGIFADWDIGTANNFIASDTEKMFGYCYEPGGVYAGIKELKHWRFGHQAMYNVEGGIINPNSAFSSNRKYKALSEFNGWAGWGSGQDVSHIVSAGPFSIAPNDSITVAFAIMAGNNLEELQETADSAYMQYNGKLISTIGQLETLPIRVLTNPVKDKLIIFTGNYKVYQISLFNSLGQEVLKDTFTDIYAVQKKILSRGIYFITISSAEGECFKEKIVVE